LRHDGKTPRSKMPSLSKPKARPAVALLVETSNAFSRELLHGIRNWIRGHGSWAIHLSEQGRGEVPPAWLKDWSGDGIIARIENERIARCVRACGVPVVNVSAADVAPGVPSVTSDSAVIASLAARHLMERGLRHFGYCGDARFDWSRRHGENFAAELRRAGFTCEYFPVSRRDAADRQGERARLAEWLRVLPKPVGVMTCYDIRGQQVLDVCRATGLRVPDEVAVIGQHNDELLCDLCDPPLSSVIPDARRIGFLAAELLDGLMRGKRPPKRAVRVAPLGVATRQSTDTLAVEDARLAKAMHFIRERAFGTLAVEDITRAAGMSRSLLERRFREVFGGSVWNHVLEMRCRAAEQLLRGTPLGTMEIAERTGFGTAEHFSTVFRQRRGVPPSALRRNDQ